MNFLPILYQIWCGFWLEVLPDTYTAFSGRKRVLAGPDWSVLKEE